MTRPPETRLAEAKRALVFSTELPPGPGGVGTHAQQVAVQLTGRGWQLEVLAPQGGASKAEISDWKTRQPMPVRTLRRRGPALLRSLQWTFALLAACRRRRPRVVLVSGRRAVWLASAVLPWLRIPFVSVAHGFEFGVRSRIARWRNRRSYRRASAVVTVSAYTRQRMLDSGVKPQRELTIPHGADAGTYSQLSAAGLADFRSRDLIAQPDRRLLITLGRVGRRKGQDLVVRALATLQADHPDLHYVLIGVPERDGEIEALAAELGVADRVHLLGRLGQETIRAHLSSADLFVMPSRHTEDGEFDGYGIAVLEAALCGLPAVVTGDSGLAEAVEPGETGLVVPPDDVEALARALGELLNDGPRRRDMAERARDSALAHKTWRRRGGEYDRLLDDIAGFPQSPSGDGR
ncbi:MAG: glycosyltransferase family 4 protein [Acidobacteriota bacterium]